MDFVLEFVCELFFEMIGSTVESDHVPKALRYFLMGLLIIPILVLLGIGIFTEPQIGTKIVLSVIAAFFAVIFALWIFSINKHGCLHLAKKEDLPQILQLYRSVIGKPGCTWTVTYPNEATLYEDFEAKQLYVLRKNKAIIGAASVVAKNELDDLDCWQFRESVREIARVMIAPQQQGKGRGKYMIRQLCFRLARQECKAVHILVGAENYHAQNLYREVGFKIRGQCQRYDHTFYACEKEL